MRKYRARWRSTGHGGEVQGTDGSKEHSNEIGEIKGTVGKYRALWESTGHGGEVQGTVAKYRAR